MSLLGTPDETAVAIVVICVEGRGRLLGENVGMEEGERKVEICALFYFIFFLLFLFNFFFYFHDFDHVTEKKQTQKVGQFKKSQ
jgi:hypothetical protein